MHFHNLHNLGASLFDHTAARGLPAYFSTHNYWLVCPSVYLLNGRGTICAGPGDRGGDCAACVGSHDAEAYRRRLGEIRARATRSLTACLAVSDAMRQTLIAEGYPADLVDVVRQAMPMEQEIWEGVGRDRAPGRAGEELTVGFLGSAYPHKGPQLLVEAAQRTRARVRVQIHGEVPDAFAAQLRALDRRGVVQLSGAFALGGDLRAAARGRRRGAAVAVVGLRAARRGRVPGGARAARRAPTRRAARGRAGWGGRARLRRAGRRVTSRASSTAWPTRPG